MRHRIRSSAAILVAALGAGSCISVVFQPQWGGDDSECSELVPFRDDWRIELETSFPLGEITTLQIGRREYMENFANRGDIEVLYDRDDERIAVELRRFTVAQCTEQALEQFSKMHLWAYATAAPPRPFADMPGGALPAATSTSAWGTPSGCPCASPRSRRTTAA